MAVCAFVLIVTFKSLKKLSSAVENPDVGTGYEVAHKSTWGKKRKEGNVRDSGYETEHRNAVRKYVFFCPCLALPCQQRAVVRRPI